LEKGGLGKPVTLDTCSALERRGLWDQEDPWRPWQMMVQVQSTWFPIIDRNPQKFVPNIYQASASDFIKAMQRVYCSPSLPSRIVLPVVP